MFKRTLLALAVSGVAVSAQAATIKTGKTAAVQATVEASITKDAKGAAGEALGTSKVFGSNGLANCTALASALNVTLVNDDGKSGKYAVAGSGAAGDTATFNAAANMSVTTVTMTGNNTCTAAIAPTLSTTATKDGVEYSTLNSIEIKPLIVAGIGGYKAEDTITIDLAGAKIDLTKTTAPTLTAGTDGVTGGGTVTFDVLDISANRVRFTVKSTNAGTTFVKGNAILELSNVFLDSTGLSTDTAVSVASTARNTSGTDYDPATATTIINLVKQYGAEVVTKLDAKIDVGADRQQFENNAKSDTLTLKVEKKTTGLELTPDTVTYNISGDFGWVAAESIDANKDGKFSTDELKKAVTLAGTDDTIKSLALNSAKDKLTLVATVVGGAVDASPAITFTVPGFDDGKLANPMISVQDFTVDATVTSTKVGTKTANMVAMTESDAGAWKLNGSVVVLSYVPFGPNTQPIIRHTNVGTRTGDITVRYMVEGEHEAWQALPGAKIEDAKPGVRDLLGLVTDALKAEGYDAATKGFKVALEVVTNVPTNDVFVFAGAKVSADGEDRINLMSSKTNR